MLQDPPSVPSPFLLWGCKGQSLETVNTLFMTAVQEEKPFSSPHQSQNLPLLCV